MKTLKVIVKQELRDGENIWVNKQSDFDNPNNPNWWKFEEFTYDQLFANFSGKTRVKKYWHEEGLCVMIDG